MTAIAEGPAQDYAIGKIRGLDRPFKVRFSVYYDPKADSTIFDAEIAGARTMVARQSGRFWYNVRR